jgi:gas vesicle protein
MNRVALISLAVVGTAVTLLFTTSKGRDYRMSMRNGTRKLGKRMRSTASDMADTVTSMRPEMADHAMA